MDYKQDLITTIHDFDCDLELLEARLTTLSQSTPTAVLIPALYSELERPALGQICDHLQACEFVQTVVICLYADSLQQYSQAVHFFSRLPQKTYVIWENGPTVNQILENLRDRGLDVLKYKGKGRAVWLGLGVASLEAHAIALHDADITTYDRSYPLKLLYPLLEKEFGISFNKAYYARLGHYPRSLYGRVTRLFVAPLLTSLTALLGDRDYLRYLHAFRYPLSGEFALTHDLALQTRITGNWGLEMGLLSEVYRNLAHRRISQIDLGVFEHKHQQLGDSDQSGLQKMCRDILGSVLRTLTETEQVVLTKDHIHALQVKFRRSAQDFAHQYFIDASFNNLHFDRHQEEVTIETFEKIILDGGEAYVADPRSSQIPAWTRALAVMPDLREQLREAAILDAAEVKALALPVTDVYPVPHE